MSSRAMHSRVDKVAANLTASTVLCALHGDLCAMGARWPLRGPEVDFYYLVRGAKIRTGMPVEEPDPYTVDRHRPETRRERQAREQLLDDAKAKVAAEEAAIMAGERQ